MKILNALYLKYLLAAALYGGTVYVLALSAENTALKIETRQYKRVDSLYTDMKNTFIAERDTINQSNQSLSLVDIGDVFDSKIKDIKRNGEEYTDLKNYQQEKAFERSLVNFFYLDERDSTFRVFIFKITEDSTLVYRIPVSTNQWNELNN